MFISESLLVEDRKISEKENINLPIILMVDILIVFSEMIENRCEIGPFAGNEDDRIFDRIID